ncbi:putative trans-sialidase, partial [Trypanosoma conorhini]
RMSRGVAVGAATVLFPLVGFLNDGSGRRACTVMYSEDNGDNWRLPAAPLVAEDCDSATLLEWAGKLFMATSGFSSQWRRRVFESGDGGKTWREAAGPVLRLLGDAYALTTVHVASDLMTATIAGRSVLLYTTLSEHSVGRQTHHFLHLWLSDGARTPLA